MAFFPNFLAKFSRGSAFLILVLEASNCTEWRTLLNPIIIIFKICYQSHQHLFHSFFLAFKIEKKKEIMEKIMNWKYLLDSIIVFSIRHHLDRGGEALLCSMPRDAAHVALLARKWMPKNQSPVISQSSKLLIIKISPKTWSSSRSSKRQKSVARLSLMNGHHATQRSVSFSPNQTSWNQVFVDFLCWIRRCCCLHAIDDLLCKSDEIWMNEL